MVVATSIQDTQEKTNITNLKFFIIVTHMVVTLDGNLEIGVHAWSDLGYLHRNSLLTFHIKINIIDISKLES